MEGLWEGKPIQYLSVIAAELCGLLAGVAILVHNPQNRWQKATVTVSVVLIVSYAIGVVIWTAGYLSGILIYNPLNPFFNASPHPLASTILLLPEFIGTAVGTVIIHKLQETRWKTAFITMAAAMLTSLAVGMLIANAAIHLA